MIYPKSVCNLLYNLFLVVFSISPVFVRLEQESGCLIVFVDSKKKLYKS